MTDAILTLDIDGVLNGHEWIHLKRGPRIMPGPAAILAAAFERLHPRRPSVYIASTWSKRIHNLEDGRRAFEFLLLTHGIDCNVAGAIEVPAGNPVGRAAAVLQLIQTQAPLTWLAIDDAPLSDHGVNNHLRPRSGRGLEPHHASKIVATFE